MENNGSVKGVVVVMHSHNKPEDRPSCVYVPTSASSAIASIFALRLVFFQIDTFLPLTRASTRSTRATCTTACRCQYVLDRNLLG